MDDKGGRPLSARPPTRQDLARIARVERSRRQVEIVIDLLAKACSVALADVVNEIEIGDVEGVAVPYLSPKALLLTKETVRDKDRLDRLYLERLLSEPQ